MAATVLAVALSGAGLLTAAAEAPAANSGDSVALITTVGGVLIALIGGAVAIINSGRKQPDVSPVRYVDPPSSGAATRELAELYREEIDRLQARLDAEERISDLWRSRAIDAGWREP